MHTTISYECNQNTTMALQTVGCAECRPTLKGPGEALHTQQYYLSSIIHAHTLTRVNCAQASPTFPHLSIQHVTEVVDGSRGLGGRSEEKKGSLAPCRTRRAQLYSPMQQLNKPHMSHVLHKRRCHELSSGPIWPYHDTMC